VIERHNVRIDSSEESMAINDDPEVAPHTLFSTRDPGNNIVAHESLNIQLFLDASVLEVFVNERVAISTRIYAESGRCFGVRPFARDTRDARWSGDGARARLLQCVGWELEPSVSWM
jgi:beta-fructofuranosidase